MEIEYAPIELIKTMSDQQLLYEEHDTLVDITHDISGSLKIHEYYDKVMEEIKVRNLTLLPRLNGTISF